MFAQLRTPCVRLSEAALASMSRGGNTTDVVTGLESLLLVLRDIEKGDDVIDVKLADYIFFPISHVLRQLEKLPVRARELTLECVGVLLRTAWKEDIQPALGIQLMILLTLMADADTQASKGLQSSEKLLALSFQCLTDVFKAMGSSDTARTALSDATNMPHLGKAVSIILDGIREGPSAEVQSAAASTIHAFCDAFPDREALAQGFFPGIMSVLTKVLTPTTKTRRSYKVLVQCLDILTKLIPVLFADESHEKLGSKNGTEKANRRSKEWISNSAPQVKLAIANIVKLRLHDREPVRQALSTFYFTLLKSCRKNLHESVPMLLETLITLASNDTGITQELKFHLAETTENDASEFSDFLRSSLYSRLVSMPTVMLKADETPKQTMIRQVTFSLRLLQEQGGDTGILDGMLASTLRDSIVSAISVSEKPKPGPSPPSETSSMELVSAQQSVSTEFEPVLAIRKSQESTVLEISEFVKQLCSNSASLSIAKDILPSIPNLNGDMQLASFWLSLNILRNNINSTLSVDDILDFGPSSSRNSRQILLDELYDFSLQIIRSSSTTTDQQDYRIHCLALETIALQAQQLQQRFRNELIDVLYPVLHLLGASNPILQQHAMVTLNIIAASCSYASAADIVVGNVDYLVNDVALRLNSFDISPQAPKVLIMMVKLAGPRLLPYLDDVVESMFVALENFHGYPKLVELLFDALRAVVEEGVRTPALAITDGGEGEGHRKPAVRSTSVEQVAETLRGMKRKREETLTKDFKESFPHRPWKEESKGKQAASDSDGNPDDSNALSTTEDDADKPPAPKTYTLLLRISKLTQHYLPSSSPYLRTSLLSLLNTVAPALAKHENSFLPLINELWPTVVARLDDDEAYVVAGAMEVMGIMCVNAGGFMRTRVDEVWPMLRRVWRMRTGLAVREGYGKGVGKGSWTMRMESLGNVVASRSKELELKEGGEQYYVQAPARITGEALVTLLCRILRYVGVSDEVFDECLEMLIPVAEKRDDVREVLEERNPDAVWLALWRRDREKGDDAAKEIRKPVGKKEWRFEFAEVY